MRTRSTLVVLLAIGLLGVGYAVATPPWPGSTGATLASPGADFSGRTVTVVTTQAMGKTVTSQIVAVDRSGSALYRYTGYSTYHDVDPSPLGKWTVTYAGADLRNDVGPCETSRCSKNYLVRTNLSTGEREVLYASWYPKWHKWHDVDRVNATHVLIADIAGDRVLLVNVSSYDPGQRDDFQYRDDVVWSWNASDHYPPPGESGGGPEDWTHINDVELLADGRIVADIRNHDQVVFIEPGEGVLEGWTLGSDDDHAILYEQHNPDYIPEACGGPALIVADSENNRVVEYAREDGSWVRTWTWRDPALQWPRDADRLPNGNTLVTDTNGDRVIEVTPAGEVVWTQYVERPYEAERLGTGDESAGGPAMGGNVTAACGTSTGGDDADPSVAIDRVPANRHVEGGRLATFTKRVLPAKALSGALFWAPVWIGVGDLLPFAGGLLALSLGGAFGAYRRVWGEAGATRPTFLRWRP